MIFNLYVFVITRIKSRLLSKKQQKPMNCYKSYSSKYSDHLNVAVTSSQTLRFSTDSSCVIWVQSRCFSICDPAVVALDVLSFSHKHWLSAHAQTLCHPCEWFRHDQMSSPLQFQSSDAASQDQNSRVSLYSFQQLLPVTHAQLTKYGNLSKTYGKLLKPRLPDEERGGGQRLLGQWLNDRVYLMSSKTVGTLLSLGAKQSSCCGRTPYDRGQALQSHSLWA